jgi:hypothetical protein
MAGHHSLVVLVGTGITLPHRLALLPVAVVVARSIQCLAHQVPALPDV